MRMGKSLFKHFLQPRILARAFLCLAGAGLLALLLLVAMIGFSKSDLAFPDNLVFADRNGVILRTVPDAKGERHVWAPISDIPERLQNAFIAAEDERFRYHPGFDPIAIGRALLSNWKGGHVVSGASTLTQQLVRTVYPRPRTYFGKAVEAVRAAKAEWVLSKDEIMEQYLNRVPMGNNIVGVALASQAYFGKTLAELDPAECALLAALPKAPSALNPLHRNNRRLLARRNWVLSRMKDLGYLAEEDFRRAKSSSVRIEDRKDSQDAPHFVDMLLARGMNGAKPNGPIRTTLDKFLQRRVEEIVGSHRSRLAPLGARQAAALVVENKGGQVLALVGSMDYSETHQGYNNGVAALRSPGSSLKPFLYGLALDSGYTVASLLEDTQRRYRSQGGEYYPRNYDRREYGPATIRAALGNSLNLSAVRLIERLGAQPFYQLLASMDLINHPDRGPRYYGLGLAIGNPEVSLEQLAAAYIMLANGGVHRKLSYLLSDPQPEEHRILSAQAAYLITDILSDPTARALTFGFSSSLDFPFRVAWKTGTSTHYRDCWTVGYTPEYTVAVWVGNFEGDAMEEVGGAYGAGPIFSDIVRFLYRDGSPGVFERPTGLVEAEVCGHSGMKPTVLCPTRKREWFMEGTLPSMACTFHRESDLYHDLGTPYAGWVYDRKEKGLSSPYSLAASHEGGPSQFSDPWAAVGGEEATHVVNVRGTMSPPPDPQAVLPPSPIPSGRVSIGGEAVTGGLIGQDPDEGVKILYPLDGDHFVLEAGKKPQVVSLEARVGSPADAIAWFVDGVEYARTGPPYRTHWPLARGGHRISALGADGWGDEVQIHVE
jgi:penicillin-binding protein 1C